MPTGRVKWFNPRKEYGFILEKDGAELFVHRSEIQNVERLDEGAEVQYEVGQGRKGPYAKKVVQLSESPFY